MEDLEMEFDDNTPQDDDMFIQETRMGYSLSCEGRYIAELDDLEAIEKIAKNWMAKNNYYPNVWFVSDHGNVTQYSL